LLVQTPNIHLSEEKKTMKQGKTTLAVLTVFVIVSMLAACGGTPTATPAAPVAAPTTAPAVAPTTAPAAAPTAAPQPTNPPAAK